jgi:hypothetical protein
MTPTEQKALAAFYCKFLREDGWGLADNAPSNLRSVYSSVSAPAFLIEEALRFIGDKAEAPKENFQSVMDADAFGARKSLEAVFASKKLPTSIDELFSRAWTDYWQLTLGRVRKWLDGSLPKTHE